MARLFFGVDGPGASDLSVEMQIADADLPRIIGYLMASKHGRIDRNEVSDDGMTQGWVTRQASPEEAAQSYASAVLDQLLSETVDFEKQQAAAAAAAQIQTIEPVE